MISYEPFYETIKRKGLSLYLLQHMGVSSRLLNSIRNDRNINTSSINKLCLLLNCSPNDIVRIKRTEDEIKILKEGIIPPYRQGLHSKPLLLDLKLEKIMDEM